MSGLNISRCDNILETVGHYYSDKIGTHGPTPRGVDWRDAEGQNKRFAQLLRHFQLERPFSLIEVGCGYGALVAFLRERGRAFTYAGFDVSAAMVDEARAQLANDLNATVAVGTGSGTADYVVASGIFNVRFNFDDDAWSRYVLETCDRMVSMARCGCAFNALTGLSDTHRKEARLWYPDPGWLLDACLTSYGRRVTLSHDYDMFEFTITINTAGLEQ